MFFATCLLPLNLFLKTIPYCIAVVWIFASAFYDVTFVLQQSFFLCLYFYLMDVFERLLAHYLKVDKQIVLQFVNSTALAVLFANLFGLSLFSRVQSDFGQIIIMIYSIIIQLIEPALMFIEMVQIIRFILSFGEKMRLKIYDDDTSDEKANLFKLITIGITLTNYGIAVVLTVKLCYGQSSLIACLALIVLVMATLLFVFNFYREYIISDASFMALYMVYLLYLASLEVHDVDIVLPKELSEATTENTLFTLVQRIELTFVALKKGLFSIALQLSPLFWIAFVLRIKCLTCFFEGELCKAVFNRGEAGSDQDEVNSEEDFAAARLLSIIQVIAPTRAALVRMSFVIGFTSIILQRFANSSFYFLARYQWIVRCIQTFASPVFYVLAAQAFHQDDDGYYDD